MSGDVKYRGTIADSLPSNAARQLNIALHNRYTFGVYSTEIPRLSKISVTPGAY
jgi:hypothetical protein